MGFLFDFGLSQEDPLTEQSALDLQSTDRLLSLASGGDVALSLLSLNETIHIKAVDISEKQIKLCRLKLAAAVHIDFPLNGGFLGFAIMDPVKRKALYQHAIRPNLPEDDVAFWNRNMQFIEGGIINAGRFEQYIRKMRIVVDLFMGRKNLQRLISCRSRDEQSEIFEKYIALRKSLQILFKIAFHPSIYRKRGLQEQALIHAGKSTGERFYSRFRDFCTASLASENYFLQYFLTGTCITTESFPHYLQPQNKGRLLKNQENFELETSSLQEALCANGKGFYTKIHLSNLGDWLTEEQFQEFMVLMKSFCDPGTKICYRYLQKNHFSGSRTKGFLIDTETSARVQAMDRFPFYGILVVTIQHENNL